MLGAGCSKMTKKKKFGGLGIGNRFKVRVMEQGRIVYQSPWAPNLILNQGMDAIATTLICNLFTYCAIGTGTSPFQDISGNVTANVAFDATSGLYRATASNPFWSSGDVGKLFVPQGVNQTGIGLNSGNGPITAFINSQNVAVNIGSAAASVSGVTFIDYYVGRTGLSSEVQRTNTYLTGITDGLNDCGTTYSNPGQALQLDPGLNQTLQLTYADVAVYNHQRTFQFPSDTGHTYTEVGFSGASGAGANLNMAALLSTPVEVLAGQELVVVYQVQVAVAPVTPIIFNGALQL